MNLIKPQEIVKLLLDCLKPDDFDIDTIVPEYIDFLQFKSSQGDSNISVEEWYHLFSKKQAEHTTFMKLFEFINIESFSEAYCESVGSMMNMIVDKRRNLADGNFSRELIFAFNSPTLHIFAENMLTGIVESIIREKSFFRELDSTNFPSYSRKLNFQALASTIGNFCNLYEKHTHLPISFFK